MNHRSQTAKLEIKMVNETARWTGEPSSPNP
jgi:hypothetical protein